ncbi:metallophosphoesterase [Sphingobium sp. DC-2]|uniref:metallophosphoesterase n=1 Tax=Sphingobium sp. DC-2 TaxID=1303256 RepID=UPI0009DCFC0D|nr:metallophosphoesterase [Sphingobium sp. DC-2]
MLNFLRRPKPRTTPSSIGEDVRVYAIGDIHGRLDLFDQLMDMIAQDEAARPPLPRLLILLGDLIDRGPHSAQMIDRAIALARSSANVRFLKGNHEEVFVAAARGSAPNAAAFRRIGGAETLKSYGLPTQECAAMDEDELAQWMLSHVPRGHVDFADDFEDMAIVGDYLFVHAGIRPRVRLEAQASADLHWIRGDFLKYGGDHGRMVIHGHSITDDVDERSNRIGIDTGAWRSGKLTAIGLQGTERWFLQTRTPLIRKKASHPMDSRPFQKP